MIISDELLALYRDAERYRFLRDYSEADGLGVYRLKDNRIESDSAWLMSGDLDIAIDAAMTPNVKQTPMATLQPTKPIPTC